MTRRTILYVQHPFVLGGSAVSLLSLLQKLDRSRYEPVIACLYDAPEVAEFYGSRGFRTVVVGGRMFSHTTAGWWPLSNPLGLWNQARWLAQFRRTARRLTALADRVGADVVHLNSLTLAPYARALERAGVPTVMHVRESVHPGHMGVRRAMLRRAAHSACQEVIYICDHDQELLTGPNKGTVIYNFVDFTRFDRNLDRDAARAWCAIRPDERVVLYLGGISRIKGIVPLLEALELTRERMPNLRCLMPGAEFPPRWQGTSAVARKVVSALGWRSNAEEKARAIFEARGMAEYVTMMPFSQEVPRLLAAADVVVFPSIEPHFARPVMEAAAMAKPVVASDIGGVNEIVRDGENGLLVPPGDAVALADALTRILRDEGGIAGEMGRSAYRTARELFDAERNAARTFAVYERLLGDGPGSSV